MSSGTALTTFRKRTGAPATAQQGGVPSVQQGGIPSAQQGGAPAVQGQHGLSAAEVHYLRKFKHWRYSGIFKTDLFKHVRDVVELLQNWPHFFLDREQCGEQLHAALESVASHLLLLSALLAGMSITPLITALPQNDAPWMTRTHGALWVLVILSNFATLGSAALFLFHLLGCPPQLGWVWACKMGAFLITIPFTLMTVSAVLSFVAVSFSAWFIYGHVVGILATAASVILLLGGLVLAWVIGKRHLETLHTQN